MKSGRVVSDSCMYVRCQECDFLPFKSSVAQGQLCYRRQDHGPLTAPAGSRNTSSFMRIVPMAEISASAALEGASAARHERAVHGVAH